MLLDARTREPGTLPSCRRASVGAAMTILMSIMRRRDGAAAGDDIVSHRVAIARALRTGAAPNDRSLDQPLRGLVQSEGAGLDGVGGGER